MNYYEGNVTPAVVYLRRVSLDCCGKEDQYQGFGYDMNPSKATNCADNVVSDIRLNAVMAKGIRC